MGEKMDLEAAADNCAEFYDFAPHGFFTLTRDAAILQANYAGSLMLGSEQKSLSGKSFTTFILPGDRPAFETFLTTVFGKRNRVAIETRLQPSLSSPPVFVRIEAIVSQSRQDCCMVVSNVTERKLAEEKLRESETLFRTITENVGDLIAMLDTDGRRIYNNPAYRQIFGEDDLAIGSNSFNEVHPEDRGYIREIFNRTVATGIGERAEFRFLLKDGTIRHIESEGNVVRDNTGKVSKVVVVSRDVTSRKLAEAALMESEQRFRAIFENAAIGIARISLTGQFLQINEVYCKIVGYSREEMLSQQFNFQQITFPEDRETNMALVKRLLNGESNSYTLEKRYIHRDGSTVWVNLSASLLRDASGSPMYFINAAQDITGRKALEAQLLHLSNFDILTDLPNRALLGDRTHQALATAKRDKTRMALMYIDLDEFKPINDTLGHNIGDMLLKEAAKRMQSCIRASDTIARIGGDEFVVLLPIIESDQDATVVADKIRHSLCQPFALAGYDVRISSSIGIAVYPDDASDEKTLLNNADAAMYYAKECGCNTVKLFAAVRKSS